MATVLLAASALLLSITNCAAAVATNCVAAPAAAKVSWGSTEEILWHQICNGDHTGPLPIDGAHAPVAGQFLSDILLNEQLAGFLPRNGLVLDSFGFSGDVDLGYGTVRVPLEIRSSKFAGEIRLNNTIFKGQIQIKDSHIAKRFFAPGAMFEAKLLMTNNRIGANLNLAGSNIVGDVTDLDRNVVQALLMNGVKISGELLMSDVVAVHGVNLVAAVIGRSVVMKNLQVTDDHNPSVKLDGTSIGGSVFLSGANLIGQLAVTGANIEGALELFSSSLHDVALVETTVGTRLTLATSPSDSPVWATNASIDLRNTTVGTIHDSSTAWLGSAHMPDSSRIRLAGLRYQDWSAPVADPLAGRPASWWLDWLPKGTAFDQQPYGEARQLLQRKLLLDQADEVKFQQWEQLRQRASGPRWLGWSIVRWTTRYGTGWGYVQLILMIVGIGMTGAVLLLSTQPRFFEVAAASRPDINTRAGRFLLAAGYSFQRLVPLVKLGDYKDEELALGHGSRVWFTMQALIGYILTACVTASLALLTNWSS